MKKIFVLIAVLLMGTVAIAQDGPKAEITGYYSYFRFNPENSGTLSSHSLNGGGGLDIPLSHSIAFRPVQVDYVLTRFGNGFTSGNQNQSNFRYQAGIQFRF